VALATRASSGIGAATARMLADREAAESQADSIEALRPEDVADAVSYIVTCDRRVAVNELLVRAAEQSW
jgi:NADP-dependent 3-hydroxy acid dehydrogenase YdfG